MKVRSMKKSNLIEGFLFVLGGIILLGIEVLTDSVLDSLLIGCATGAICAGVVTVCKYVYWNAERNRECYRQKIADESIELHDKLKSMLRDKSGRYCYTIGIITVCASIMIFSILGELGLVAGSRTIVLFLGGYLVFQIVTGIVIFQCLLRKYES